MSDAHGDIDAFFVKVVELGGFAGAARALRMSPPAVTRAIAMLEEGIGARLLQRTTRSVKPTEAGARYLEDCRRILLEVDEADAGAARRRQSRPVPPL